MILQGLSPDNVNTGAVVGCSSLRTGPKVMIIKSHRRATEIMEKNSEHLEFLKYREGKKEMSDVALAKSLIKDIGGGGQVATMIFNAYTTLSRMFPQSQWTARRLKSWWNQETENVLHREMRELYQAAQVKKAEQELIREARNEHKQFLAKTARLAALLEYQDEDFNRPQIDALRGSVGNVAGSRDSGDR